MNAVKLLRAALIGCCALLAAVPALGQWYQFGRAEDEPRIAELKLNNIDATRFVDAVVMSREDLAAGKIVFRGRAEVGRGTIGIVEYSLDNGQSWNAAQVADRGLFSFELRPEFERAYRVIVRALTTAGRQSRDEDHSFRLQVTASDTAEEVRRTFLRMLEAYQNENLGEFMRHVSDFFQGNLPTLEDAVRSDFANFDNIRIQPNITRVTSGAGDYEVYFTFNRQVYATRSARLLRDQAASTMAFRRAEGGMKLVRLAAPLIFGVSNPADVATTVTAQSVGQQVITVNPTTGTAALATQTATPPASSGIGSSVETGTATLPFSFTAGPVYSYKSFAFLNADQFSETTVPSSYAFSGDFMVAGAGNLFVKGGRSARTCPTSYAALTVAPTTGYTAGGGAPIAGVAVGNCYVFQLVGPRYAAIEVTSFTVVGCPAAPCSNSFSFRYKYQTNGSTSLQ